MSVHRDVDAELRFHFDARIEELVEQGMTRDAARAQALAEFGDVDATRASLREIDHRVAKRRNRAEVLDALVHDARYSLRSLLRTPAVSLTIIVTLALGVGVNAAMFSLLDTIYLRPPAGVVDPGTIRRAWVEKHYRSGTQYSAIFDYSGFSSIRKNVGERVDVTLFGYPNKLKIGRGENAPFAMTSGTEANYFRFLGVTPLLGRFYSDDEAGVATAVPVAVLSESFWRRSYDADPNVLGKTIELRNKKFTIIGVTRGEFRGVELDATDVWTPIAPLIEWRGSPTPWWQNPSINGFAVLLRMKPGVMEGQLNEQITRAMREPGVGWSRDTLARSALGAINRQRGPGNVSMEMQVAQRLAGVAILVLLIACANVVNLLLARAVNRRREIAVRLALGISRARLIRLLVTESTLLAMGAAAAALVAASAGGSALRTLLMPQIQWAGAILHWRVLLFALAAAVIAGVVAGLVPALRASSPRLTEGLRAGAREGGAHRSRLRTSLVITQAALSVVLLIGAVLFVRSLRNVKSHDIGYSVDRLGFSQVSYDVKDSIRDREYPNRLRALDSRVAAIPGVERVAFTSMRPKDGISWVSYFPDTDTSAHKKPDGMYTVVSPSFFATTGMKILRGQTFDAGGSGPFAVIVNDAMAKALWPDENPLGKCIRFNEAANPCATIIGVVQTAIESTIDEKPAPHLYLSLDNPPIRTWGAATMIVRAAPGHLANAQTATRELLRAAFPGGIPVQKTMLETMAPDYRPWDLGAKLFTLFGVLALLVAAVGVYSSVSYAVNQRTHEFGVRIALGARAIDVLRQVVGDGVRTIVIGVVLGVLLTLAGGKLVASLLYGIEPNNVATMGIVSGVLVVIAIGAAIVPAWRASRADPVSALRAE